MRGFSGGVEEAANIRVDGDSVVQITASEFLEIYPQFSTDAIPKAFLDMTLDRANASIQEARWRSSRKMAVCLLVAHYCTLYLKTAVPEGVTAPSVIAGRGESKGAATSKSVGSVSVGYGSAEGSSDLTGYGSLRDTVFGQQLATMARMVGAGMVVIR